MDGNGRWAKRRGRPRVFGHRKGANRVREIVEAAGQMGIGYLTLYAFSEENWARPRDEVTVLFSLLSRYLRSEIKALYDNNVCLKGIGNRDSLPADCRRLLEDGEARTADRTGLKLILALSYGGRSEIIDAVRRIAGQVDKGLLRPEAICQEHFSSEMETAGVPDPDLLIRTSGEQRISNFLLWQMAYTELYFTNVFWPDFDRSQFEKALEAYACRDRRYGKLSSPGFLSQVEEIPDVRSIK